MIVACGRRRFSEQEKFHTAGNVPAKRADHYAVCCTAYYYYCEEPPASSAPATKRCKHNSNAGSSSVFGGKESKQVESRDAIRQGSCLAGLGRESMHDNISSQHSCRMVSPASSYFLVSLIYTISPMSKKMDWNFCFCCFCNFGHFIVDGSCDMRSGRDGVYIFCF